MMAVVRRKSTAELARMRRAGAIVADTLDLMVSLVKPGISTGELDEAAEAHIRGVGAEPSFKGYMGYPASICASVNEEIVHGIPNKRVLEDGDIVSIDCGAIWEGYQGDAALTIAVGQVADDVWRLLEATRLALMAGIAAVRDGARMGDVSHAIEAAALERNCEVVREYGGHGIGATMHEPPHISNWGPAGQGIRLRAGMTFCLEPMLTLGGWQTRTLDDGWTVVTADGSRSAHFEHTIVVTREGAEILTPWRVPKRDGGER
jgi:methionyl aminopeptidase